VGLICGALSAVFSRASVDYGPFSFWGGTEPSFFFLSARFSATRFSRSSLPLSSQLLPFFIGVAVAVLLSSLVSFTLVLTGAL